MAGRRGCLLLLVLLLAAPVAAKPLQLSAFHRQSAYNQRLLGFWTVIPTLAAGLTWYSPFQKDHGTFVNGPTWVSSSTSSWGGAISLTSGSSQYIDFGTNPIFDGSDAVFTVRIEVEKVVDTGTTSYLVAKRDATGGIDGGWFVRVATATGIVTARLTDGASGNVIQRDTVALNLYDGLKHSIVVVFTTNTSSNVANDLEIYVDGLVDDTNATRGSNPYAACPTCELRVGTEHSLGNYATLHVNTLAIYQGALSTAMIRAMAACGGASCYDVFQTPPNNGAITVVPRKVKNE